MEAPPEWCSPAVWNAAPERCSPTAGTVCRCGDSCWCCQGTLHPHSVLCHRRALPGNGGPPRPRNAVWVLRSALLRNAARVRRSRSAVQVRRSLSGALFRCGVLCQERGSGGAFHTAGERCGDGGVLWERPPECLDQITIGACRSSSVFHAIVPPRSGLRGPSGIGSPTSRPCSLDLSA